PGLARLQLAEGTGEERPAAPDVHDGAEHRGDPARPPGHRVPEQHGEHGREGDHGDCDDEVDPEQPTELADMVAVAPMAAVAAVLVVAALMIVLPGLHGVAVVLGVRVVPVAGIGGRCRIVGAVRSLVGGVAVMMVRIRIRHGSSLPLGIPLDRVMSVPPRACVARGGPAQEAGWISLSTTHLWLVIFMPPAS